ncbi:MAG: UDP-N-acetylmuramoyl-L-alanyl-D-glutamate--2,6-diaminopimelate ligase, partial [Desulfovibrionales bacterium]|nr:UDP-N-acetylmuramoyl-L-alanyl-D-glutamate--2,6-diaminopimelate ligase [Desulfovibrionales bacterium]
MDPCPAAFSDIEVNGLETRAQSIRPGFIFFAVKGYAADGHDYIDTALERGAALIIAEKNPDNHDKILVVDNSRKAVADMAAAYYGHPSKQMKLVGITGTNGKTTITYLLESIFTQAGHTCGVMGTINIRYPGHCTDAPTTTPDALAIQRTLYEMKEAGVTHVVMEVSSHGLAMHRVDGCDFDTCVFTNLSQDHLDFHGSMEDYYHCKKSLFTHHLPQGSIQGTAVVNLDGGHGKELALELAKIHCPMIRVSHSQEADLRASQVVDQITGLSATLKRPGELAPFCSELTGKFNLENILCAAGAGLALGFSLEQIAQGLHACPVIPGRLERVANTINRHLFVDYAHTPDALESILKTLVKRAPKRVITVFGCGGNRDKTKRAPMGKAACCYSDIAIVTSDNPR